MKVAVVTGGASRGGIGEAIARALAEEGYALAIGGARSVERLKKLAEELGGGEVFYHHLDVSRPESVEEFANKTIERFGKVDVVVANAGLGYFGRLEELGGEEEFHEMIEVNLLGMWRTIKAFLRNLKETNGVVVAVTSDVSARLLPYGGRLHGHQVGSQSPRKDLPDREPPRRKVL